MPYTVAGTLKLPESGKPAVGVILKFVAMGSISPVLGRSESTVVTGATGSYSIALEFNSYSVFATLFDNKPIQCGEIILNSSVPTGLDLPTLLNGGQYEPPTPAWILQIQAWITQASTSAANSATSASQSAASAQQASAFAKNASDSALQASQIAGLGTVADAISLAALPFPDVWLPLNDSLRLLAGYGREVKVGSDVVAMYAGCDRSTSAFYRDKLGKLKKALSNEPRLEAYGLLCEGISTNSCTKSGDFSGAPYTFTRATLSFTETSPDPDGIQKACTLLKNAAGSSYMYLQNVSYTSGKTWTFSIFAKAGTFNVIRLAVQSGLSGQATPLEIDFNLNDGSYGKTPASGTYGSVEVVPYADGWYRVAISCPILTSATANHTIIINPSPDASMGSIHFWGLQIEDAPSMSSYIATSGSAVARGADFPWLQREGNDNYFGKMTLAVEVHCNGRGVEGVDRGIFSAYPYANAYEMLYIHASLSRPMWAYGTQGSAGGTMLAQVEDGGVHTIVAQCDGAKNRVYLDGQKGPSEFDPVNPGVGPVTGTKLFLGYGAGSTNARHLWGHLRNLRMWINKNISDAQCRSIK